MSCRHLRYEMNDHIVSQIKLIKTMLSIVDIPIHNTIGCGHTIYTKQFTVNKLYPQHETHAKSGFSHDRAYIFQIKTK